MARRSTGGNASRVRVGNASQAKGRETTKTKRRLAPAATLRKRLTVSDLIKELNEAREQQTATSEVLQVINASAGDLTPVFDAMLEKAMRLCEASFGALAAPDGEFARWVALHGITGPYAELITSKPYRWSVLFGPTLEKPSVIHILDLKDGEGYRRRAPSIVEAVERGGVRTWLLVPLLKGNTLLGAFVFYRQEVRAFSSEQISLLQNFADQAVIAMENARLLNELRERTDELARLFEKEETRAWELAKSLDDLRAAQDRLIRAEKLAALGRLVAGMAHEINSPVGTSLTVASALERKRVAFAADVGRGQLKRSRLTEFLKVVEDASALLASNLNRAVDLIQSFKQVAVDQGYLDRRSFYAGDLTEQVLVVLRPALQGKNIGLNVECQPDLAMNSYPGPYGQALTNLFLNAVMHAFPDGKGGAIDIKVRASGSDKVEVLFSDNGCGMSADVARQAFNPFFTTRRESGSTGLGLHIVHNIVTNRLGGQLNIDSAPGGGTKIQIILPLTAPAQRAASGPHDTDTP
jgi:signal transduction histidine kinase